MPNKLLHSDTYCYARFFVSLRSILHKNALAVCAGEQGVTADACTPAVTGPAECFQIAPSRKRSVTT